MTVRCMDCSRFALKGSPLGRSGFGHCKGDKPAHLYSAHYPRECAKFTPAGPDIVARRERALKGA